MLVGSYWLEACVWVLARMELIFIPSVAVLWFKFVTKTMVITNQYFSFAFFVFMTAFFVFTQYKSPVCFSLYSHETVDAFNQRGDTTREMTQTNQRAILYDAASCSAIKWREQSLGKFPSFPRELVGHWSTHGRWQAIASAWLLLLSFFYYFFIY